MQGLRAQFGSRLAGNEACFSSPALPLHVSLSSQSQAAYSIICNSKTQKALETRGTFFFPYTGRNSFDSSTWPIGRRVLYSLIIPSEDIPMSCCRSAEMLDYGHLPGSSAHVSHIPSICHILFLKFQNFFILNHIWPHGLGQRDCVSVTQAHRVVEGDQHQFIPAKHLEQCQTAHGGLSVDGSCPCR